jgi:hypothetical protein
MQTIVAKNPSRTWQGEKRLKIPPAIWLISASPGTSRREAQDGPRVENASANVSDCTERLFPIMTFPPFTSNLTLPMK